MAIQMTKAEYEAKYGVAPFIQSESDLDISISPIRMTRAEYDEKYGEKKGSILSPAKEAISGLGTLYGGSEQGIASRLVEDVKAGTEEMKKGNILKGVAKSGLRTAGDIAGTIFAPVGAAIQATGFNKLTDYVAEKFWDTSLGDKILDNKNLQDFALTHPNAEEDFGRALNLLLSKGEKGKIEPKTMVPRTIEQVKGIVGNPPPGPGGGGSGLRGIPSKIRDARSTKATEKVAQEISEIENNYATTRKTNDFTKDAGTESRNRIAQTDVLVNAVDDSGLIRTKQPGGAVEQYRKLTIDGAESVVRDNLIREKAKVNLAQLAKELTVQIYRSGLEGAELSKAIRGLKAELDGLKLRADELGNIDLSKVHDAKISTTQNINYKTDSTPTIKYRKAKATAYKNIVENNSSVSVEVNGKNYGIKEINGELGKYYEDIARLESLDGKRVKGGKLGKYSSQIAGNIAGGAVGGMFGGLGGAAVGTVVGGEASAFLRGKSMSKTFGEGGKDVISNAILERAKAEGKLPPKINLKVSDVKVGAPKGIPKTKEVLKLERDISKNVEQQKAAIKAGDFALVATLKEIYQVLVQYLKDTITEIRKNPEGGFAKISDSSKSDKMSKPKLKESIPSIDDSIEVIEKLRGLKPTDFDRNNKVNLDAIGEVDELIQKSLETAKLSPQELNQARELIKLAGKENATPIFPKAQDLIQEATKYKSAEEFVKDVGDIEKGGTGRISTKEGRIDFYKEGENIIVSDLYVSEVARKKGLGSSLLEEVEKVAGKENKNVQLTPIRTEPNTPDLVKFYEKRGYVKNGSGESGEGMIKTKSQLTDIWNKANGKMPYSQ